MHSFRFVIFSSLDFSRPFSYRFVSFCLVSFAPIWLHCRMSSSLFGGWLLFAVFFFFFRFSVLQFIPIIHFDDAEMLRKMKWSTLVISFSKRVSHVHDIFLLFFVFTFCHHRHHSLRALNHTNFPNASYTLHTHAEGWGKNEKKKISSFADRNLFASERMTSTTTTSKIEPKSKEMATIPTINNKRKFEI